MINTVTPAGIREMPQKKGDILLYVILVVVV